MRYNHDKLRPYRMSIHIKWLEMMQNVEVIITGVGLRENAIIPKWEGNKMRTAKLFGLSMIIILMVLSACSKDSSGSENTDIEESDTFNKTGMPIVDEPITLKFMTG